MKWQDKASFSRALMAITLDRPSQSLKFYFAGRAKQSLFLVDFTPPKLQKTASGPSEKTLSVDPVISSFDIAMGDRKIQNVQIIINGA